MITLYDYELSSDCYKARLMMALLEVPYTRVELDVYPGCEHRQPAFRAINPLGAVPVIDVDGFVLGDAQAILVYLARRYDATGRWLPRDPLEQEARIAMWLGFAGRLSASAGAARLHDAMFLDVDVERCRTDARELLRVLDEHLWFTEQNQGAWICGGSHPTLADVACFPDVMLCEEGGISRLPYPAVRRWTDRFKSIRNFVPMSGIFGSLPAAPIPTVS